ncbi:MAG: hypothetical protein ACRDZ7_23055 [Acidimicrobiia bacterium]
MSIWDGKLVIVGPGATAASLAGARAALVVGVDAAAVGVAVDRLAAGGVRACGFVGAPDDESLRQMAAELFPGAELVAGPSA